MFSRSFVWLSLHEYVKFLTPFEKALPVHKKGSMTDGKSVNVGFLTVRKREYNLNSTRMTRIKRIYTDYFLCVISVNP